MKRNRKTLKSEADQGPIPNPPAAAIPENGGKAFEIGPGEAADPPAQADGQQADRPEEFPCAAFETPSAADEPTPPRFRPAPPLEPEESEDIPPAPFNRVPDEDELPSPAPAVRRCLPKPRWWKALFPLFRLVRRYPRNPPLTTVVDMLVADGEERRVAESFVQDFRTVVRVALEACGGKRHLAFVATAMELRCRCGHRDHCEWNLSLLTGLRPCVVRDALASLCHAGIAEAHDCGPGYYRVDHMLVRPLSTGHQQPRLGAFQSDPIELLRLEREELAELPHDALAPSVVDAVLQAEQDQIEKEEKRILDEIRRGKEQVEMEREAAEAAALRCRQQQDRLKSLASDLADLRWRRRYPLRAKAPENMDPRPAGLEGYP